MKRKWFLILMLVLFCVSMMYAAGISADKSEDDEIYLKVDKKPEFPGGQTALDRYIKNNLRHPVNIGEMDIHGRIVCEFVINKDGSVSDIEVVRSNYPAMNNEVLRVLREMPKWEPGVLNEKPVRVKYTLPVIFHLP